MSATVLVVVRTRNTYIYIVRTHYLDLFLRTFSHLSVTRFQTFHVAPP